MSANFAAVVASKLDPSCSYLYDYCTVYPSCTCTVGRPCTFMITVLSAVPEQGPVSKWSWGRDLLLKLKRFERCQC